MYRIALLSCLAFACANPAEDKSAAKVSEAPPAAAPAAPATPAAPSAAAPAAATPSFPGTALAAVGSVGFVGAKITKSHTGTFGGWTGSLSVDGDKLTGGRVEVNVSTVKTDSAKLDGHLQSPDFFNVAAFPSATFVSTEIKAGAPADSKLEGANSTIIGDLTLHGVTKRLEVPAKITAGAGAATVKTEFVINRQDFGIAFPGKPDDLIRDEVVITVDLRTGA